MSALKKSAAENIYRMEGSSVWIYADKVDIWIVKGENGLSISVWGPDPKQDVIDPIYIQWDNIKGERK
jgi:hypothetical protein